MSELKYNSEKEKRFIREIKEAIEGKEHSCNKTLEQQVH